MAFLNRQQQLLDDCTGAIFLPDWFAEETGTGRSGRSDKEEKQPAAVVSQRHDGRDGFRCRAPRRLDYPERAFDYTRRLASAVMDALFYFIGHDCPQPVSAAAASRSGGACRSHACVICWRMLTTAISISPREIVEAGDSLRPMSITRLPGMGERTD